MLLNVLLVLAINLNHSLFEHPYEPLFFIVVFKALNELHQDIVSPLLLNLVLVDVSQRVDDVLQ